MSTHNVKIGTFTGLNEKNINSNIFIVSDVLLKEQLFILYCELVSITFILHLKTSWIRYNMFNFYNIMVFFNYQVSIGNRLYHIFNEDFMTHNYLILGINDKAVVIDFLGTYLRMVYHLVSTIFYFTSPSFFILYYNKGQEDVSINLYVIS